MPSGDTVKTINLVQWNYVLIGFMQLNRKEEALQFANNVISSQKKELAAKDSALTALKNADSVTDTIETKNKALTKKEKRREKWQKIKKDFGLAVLGAVATAQTIYILVEQIKPD